MTLPRNQFNLLLDSLATGKPVDLALGPVAEDMPPTILRCIHITAIDRSKQIFEAKELLNPVEWVELLQVKTHYPFMDKFEYEADEDSPTVINARALPNWREPKVGEECWVGSSLYIDHGWDDFHGGKATIAKVEHNWLCTNAANRLNVVLEEHPGSQYNWYPLIEREEKNRELYGDERAYEDPEYHPFYAPDGKR